MIQSSNTKQETIGNNRRRWIFLKLEVGSRMSEVGSRKTGDRSRKSDHEEDYGRDYARRFLEY